MDIAMRSEARSTTRGYPTGAQIRSSITWSRMESPRAGYIRTATARPISWGPTILPKGARRTVASNWRPNSKDAYHGALARSRAPRYPVWVSLALACPGNRWCERGDLNPHALRHRILSPARLPFRHSRVQKKYSKDAGF